MRKILTFVLFFGIYTAQAQYEQMAAPADTSFYRASFSKMDNILNVLREFRFQAYIQRSGRKRIRRV